MKRRQPTTTIRSIPPEILADLKKVPAFSERTAGEQKKMLVHLYRVVETLALIDHDLKVFQQRRENGQILAEEGREARKPKTETRAAKICRLYKKVRKSHAPGRAGNGETLAEVAHQFGPLPGKESPITVQAIRKILKRSGVPCR